MPGWTADCLESGGPVSAFRSRSCAAIFPADTSARGRVTVRAEREMASDTRTSSSLTYRRVWFARCGVVIAHPERERPGRRVVVVAITLFMVESSARPGRGERAGHVVLL